MSKNLEDTDKEEKLKNEWLSPMGLSIEYGFSKSTQAKMRMASTSSTIPFSKVSGYVRYKRKAINEWLEEHQIQGTQYTKDNL
ncbi:hypothetical protein [Candidatus Sulfurimonas baltica]|uniref:Helix-turn-helix domain-containing protein n=1 Tax=Candidatus Sulfurimonas baltica TaxID=2740404 RepID=A0A7S7LUZ5_9BACT|nr:hypothetical protein [Candidatus Sulfurimonas baltica]QOY51977.1 hypothetical protein HUE88_12935 [Candidatus Sulfurimonas baltica]